MVKYILISVWFCVGIISVVMFFKLKVVPERDKLTLREFIRIMFWILFGPMMYVDYFFGEIKTWLREHLDEPLFWSGKRKKDK